MTKGPTAKPKTYFYNSDIPHEVVRVADSESNTLGPPQTLASLLESTKLDKDRVELVTARPEPIVRVISLKLVRQLRQEENLKARLKLKEQKNSNKETKQLQMTWNVDGNDLERKLDQARVSIASGHHVNIVLSKKGGVPLPTRDAMDRKLDEIVAGLKDVAEEANSKSIGKQLTTIYLRPRSRKSMGSGGNSV